MSIQPINMFAVQTLGTVAGTLYAMPSSPANLILVAGRVRFTNLTNATRAVTLYKVPNAGSPGSTNEILQAEAIAANSHVDVDIPTMAVSETLQALADAGSAINAAALNAVLVS